MYPMITHLHVSNLVVEFCLPIYMSGWYSHVHQHGYSFQSEAVDAVKFPTFFVVFKNPFRCPPWDPYTHMSIRALIHSIALQCMKMNIHIHQSVKLPTLLVRCLKFPQKIKLVKVSNCTSWTCTLRPSSSSSSSYSSS